MLRASIDSFAKTLQLKLNIVKSSAYPNFGLLTERTAMIKHVKIVCPRDSHEELSW